MAVWVEDNEGSEEGWIQWSCVSPIKVGPVSFEAKYDGMMSPPDTIIHFVALNSLHACRAKSYIVLPLMFPRASLSEALSKVLSSRIVTRIQGYRCLLVFR